MTRRKLEKLKAEIAACREKQVKALELIAIAKKLGRVEENRGKEPVYAYPNISDRPPLAIPKHGGKDIAKGTKASILDVLQQDIEFWDDKVER